MASGSLVTPSSSSPSSFAFGRLNSLDKPLLQEKAVCVCVCVCEDKMGE